MRRRSCTRKPSSLVAPVLAAVFALQGTLLRAETALVDLVVNGERRGTVEVELDDAGDVRFPPAALRTLLSGTADPAIVDRALGADRPPGPRELASFGVSVAFDRAALIVTAVVDPASMPETRIGVASTPRVREPEVQVVNAPFSITLGSDLDYDAASGSGGGTSFTQGVRLGLTPAIRALGAVTEGHGTLVYDEYGIDGDLIAAQVVVDFPREGTRLRSGTVSPSATSFQASPRLYGLSYGMDDSLPGAARERVSLDDRFLIYREADVTVYVNGVPSRQLRLPPGNYRFADLPLSSGLNEVRVVIAERGEAPRSVSLGIPFDSALLAPGRMDYSIVLGSPVLDAPEPYGAFRFALGLRRGFQVGTNAEGDRESALGGFSALVATAFGSFGMEGALSVLYGSPSSTGFPPFASRVYWRLSLPKLRRAPQLGAAAEYRAAGFAPPGSASSETDSVILSAQASQAIPGSRASLSVSGYLFLADAAAEGASATLGFSVPFGRSTFISLSGGGDWRSGEALISRISAIATFVARGAVVSYAQSVANETDHENLSVNLGEGGRRAVNAYGQGLFFPGSDRAIELSGIEHTRLAAFSLSARYADLAAQAEPTWSGSASAASTLVYADGVFAATSAPSSAYALLTPGAEFEGRRAELRSSGGAPAASPAGRAAVVGGLVPYRPYAADIELPDSPPEDRPSPQSIGLSPAYRSVSVIRFGAAPSIAVRGVLVDRDGVPVAFMPGAVVGADGRSARSAGTFTDEEGVFECYGLAPGTVSVRWDDGSVSSFFVPEAQRGTMIDLGAVPLRETEEGASS